MSGMYYSFNVYHSDMYDMSGMYDCRMYDMFCMYDCWYVLCVGGVSYMGDVGDGRVFCEMGPMRAGDSNVPPYS